MWPESAKRTTNKEDLKGDKKTHKNATTKKKEWRKTMKYAIKEANRKRR